MPEQEQERINFEADLELQRKLNEREEVPAEATQYQTIDWSDHAVLRYHALQNRPYSVAEVRKNMIIEKKGSRKKSLARKRASEKQSEESTKRQKIKDDVEKEELKAYLDLALREEFAIEIESLATNEMLDDFDRQDVLDLHRLVKTSYMISSPEGYDLMLWGDLKILFEPDEEDEVWKNQHEYTLISWKLFDSYGIHILLMNNEIAIYMMTEKKYPLNQEMLSRMLSKRLEVDHESTMAYELLKFIKSQV
ncbi:hypothetical protein Tco_0470745 [Tanacetum coccineum]